MVDRQVRGTALVAVAAACAVAGGHAIASTSGWSTGADFAAGSLSSTVVDADSVVLDTTRVGRPDSGIAWWDGAWGQRRCVTVTNNEPAPLTEYQIVVGLDTATPIAGGRMDPTGADLRAVASGFDTARSLDRGTDGLGIDDGLGADRLPAAR